MPKDITINEKLKLLILRYQQGDDRAFTEIFKICAPYVREWIDIKRPACKEDAEDLFSEIFIKICNKKKFPYKEQDCFLGWLYRVTNNYIITYHKKRKSFMEINENLIEGVMDNEDIIEKENMERYIQELENAINELPAHQQELIRMRFNERKTYQAIADKEGKGHTRSSIRKRIVTICKKLNKIILRNRNASID